MCKNAQRGHTVSPDTSAIGSSCGVKRGVNYTRGLIGRLVPVGASSAVALGAEQTAAAFSTKYKRDATLWGLPSF